MTHIKRFEEWDETSFHPREAMLNDLAAIIESLSDRLDRLESPAPSTDKNQQ